MLDVGFKGWSVASRWATEENGLDPWLAAIDPAHGGEGPSPERFRDTVAEIQREVLRRMIATFGFSDEVSMISRKEPGGTVGGEFQTYREHWRQVVLAGERETRGLSAAYVGNSFIPIGSMEEVGALQQMFSDESNLWLATILETPLTWAEKGEFLAEYETDRSQGFLSRNGLAVADLRQVQAVHAV